MPGRRLVGPGEDPDSETRAEAERRARQEVCRALGIEPDQKVYEDEKAWEEVVHNNSKIPDIRDAFERSIGKDAPKQLLAYARGD